MRKSREGGIGLNYLIKTLQILKQETSSAELYKKAPFRYKKSQLTLIRNLLKNHYIIKRKEKRRFRDKNPMVFYSLSFEGIMLLYFLERLNA